MPNTTMIYGVALLAYIFLFLYMGIDLSGNLPKLMSHVREHMLIFMISPSEPKSWILLSQFS